MWDTINQIEKTGISGARAINSLNSYTSIIKELIEKLNDLDLKSLIEKVINLSTLSQYYELKKNEEAIEYYKKAGTHFPEDEAISSEYLFRAASFLELNGKNDAAIEIYKQIKQNYPKSEKGFNIDKYINRLQVQP